jgi:hypothetical protein
MSDTAHQETESVVVNTLNWSPTIDQMLATWCDAVIDSGLIFVKIVLLHIGFQLSGVYSVLFPNSN